MPNELPSLMGTAMGALAGGLVDMGVLRRVEPGETGPGAAPEIKATQADLDAMSAAEAKRKRKAERLRKQFEASR